jgi:hypothetical protein
MKGQHSNWVRRMEHAVLRVVSFIFSVVSAHAILWYFGALDRMDQLQPWIKWGIAGGFALLGYFVSRGLAHRLLNKERIGVYVVICLVFELVEVVCNYAMAAVAVQWISWLRLLPGPQNQLLTFLTYVVLSIVPLVTIGLAWVDMDLDRAKQGYSVQGFAGAGHVATGAGLGKSASSIGARPATPPSPKVTPSMASTTRYAPSSVASYPSASASYQQGYAGAKPSATTAAMAERAAPAVPIDEEEAVVITASTFGGRLSSTLQGMVGRLPFVNQGRK